MGRIDWGEWNHVAVTYDKTTRKAGVYVEGEERSNVIPNVLEPASAGMLFGGSAGTHFNGSLDEFAFYGRQLSYQEIDRLWQEEKAVFADIQSQHGHKARYFDGRDDWVDLQNVDQQLKGGSELSVSLWARVLDASSMDQALISQHGSRRGFLLGVYDDASVRTAIRTDRGNWKYLDHDAGSGFDVTAWHHYTLTWNGSVQKLFIDGTLVGSIETAGVFDSEDLSVTPRRAKLARNYWGTPTDTFVEAELDELSIWERALTSEEVGRLAGGLSACEVKNGSRSMLERGTGRPELTEMQCKVDGVWTSCDSIAYCEEIESMRAFCEDPDNDLIGVDFKIRNLHDALSQDDDFGWIMHTTRTTTQTSEGWWVHDEPVRICESGHVQISAECRDQGHECGVRCDQQLPSNQRDWSVPLADYFIDCDQDYLPEAFCQNIDDVKEIETSCRTRPFNNELSCHVQQNPCSRDNAVGVISMHRTSNAHALLYNASPLMQHVCCQGDITAYSTPVMCGEAAVLSLAYQENSHTQQYDPLSDYQNHVCLTSLDQSTEVYCRQATSCEAHEECVITYAKDNNSHVAACNSVDAYQNRICCQITDWCGGADISRNGLVGLDDAGKLMTNRGRHCSAQDMWCDNTDIDRNGIVDDTDAAIIMARWGERCI